MEFDNDIINLKNERVNIINNIIKTDEIISNFENIEPLIVSLYKFTISLFLTHVITNVFKNIISKITKEIKINQKI